MNFPRWMQAKPHLSFWKKSECGCLRRMGGLPSPRNRIALSYCATGTKCWRAIQKVMPRFFPRGPELRRDEIIPGSKVAVDSPQRRAYDVSPPPTQTSHASILEFESPRA